MNKLLIFVIGIFLASCSVLTSNEVKNDANVEQSASAHLNYVEQNYQLEYAQADEFRNITQDFAQQVEEVLNLDLDGKEKFETIESLWESRLDKLKSVLTYEQFQRYEDDSKKWWDELKSKLTD